MDPPYLNGNPQRGLRQGTPFGTNRKILGIIVLPTSGKVKENQPKANRQFPETRVTAGPS